MSTDSSPTVAVETLGCKLNQYESDSLATTLQRRGYRVVPFDAQADAYIINSCTVTNKADRKSRNTVYRARRTGGSGAIVILTGCFVDSRSRQDQSRGGGEAGTPPITPADRIDDPRSGATYSVDNGHKNAIPDLIDAHLRGELPGPGELSGDIFGFSTPEQIFHTRTNIKVQDGCDNFCTFCIIPFVRGRGTSRLPAAVLREADEAIRAGSRELVLTGVNMSRYRSAEDTDFVDLVAQILDLPGDFRLRISSLEPDGLDDRFVALFRHPKLAPHLHLCAQSGSDRILLQMRRMYTIGQFREIATALREDDPLFNITTDLIVGFPGEQDDDHAASEALIGEIGIGHVHTFPFSVRRGTRAERMAGQLPHRAIKQRAAAIRAASNTVKRRYREQLIGATERVLVERLDQRSDGRGRTLLDDPTARSREGHRETIIARGLGEHYVPVRFPVSRDRVQLNEFYSVEITDIEAGEDPDLIGRIAY